MTSNQIAAASERELERHNATVEEETQRHNEAMEALESTMQDITQNYQTEKNRLEDWYNTKYIEYLNASEEHKVELEKEVNAIKQQMADSDKLYKEQMTQIERDKYAADKAYKEMMAEIGYMGKDIEDRKLEYQRHQWDIQNDLSRQEIEQRKAEMTSKESIANLQYSAENLRIQQGYNIQLNEQMYKWTKLKSEMELLEQQANTLFSQEVKNYMDTAMSPFRAFDFDLGL